MFLENILKCQSRFLKGTQIIHFEEYPFTGNTRMLVHWESHLAWSWFLWYIFLLLPSFSKFQWLFFKIFFDDPHLAIKEAVKDHNLVPGLLILKSCQCQAFRHQIRVSMPCACIHLPLPLSSATFHLLSFLRMTRFLLLPSLCSSCSLVKTFAEEMLVVCELVAGKQPKLTTESLINYEYQQPLHRTAGSQPQYWSKVIPFCL